MREVGHLDDLPSFRKVRFPNTDILHDWRVTPKIKAASFRVFLEGHVRLQDRAQLTATQTALQYPKFATAWAGEHMIVQRDEGPRRKWEQHRRTWGNRIRIRRGKPYALMTIGFREPDNRGAVEEYVHRVVAAIFKGVPLRVEEGAEPIADRTKHVLHWDCPPGCVHPMHLRWGTAKDNKADVLRVSEDQGPRTRPEGQGTWFDPAGNPLWPAPGVA
jgi:hypothetical protein